MGRIMETKSVSAFSFPRLTDDKSDHGPSEKRVNNNYTSNEHDHLHPFEACKSIHEWRGLLRELASRAPTRFSAFRVLCGGARGGLTKLGVFSSLFSFPAPDDSSSGPPRARVQELLPLPPAAATRHLRSLGQDISDYNLRLTAETLCNAAVHCLNFLSCAGWTSKPILLSNKSSLSKVQEVSLTHLWDSILQFLEFGDEEFSLEKIIEDLIVR